MFATIFGVAASLGLGASQINSGFHYLTGMPISYKVQLVIIAITTILFITSAGTGVSKGIKYLSNTNMVLAVILFVSFLFLGPTQYLIELFSTTFGSYVQQLPSMGLRFAPFNSDNNQWVKDWTIFTGLGGYHGLHLWELSLHAYLKEERFVNLLWLY